MHRICVFLYKYHTFVKYINYIFLRLAKNAPTPASIVIASAAAYPNRLVLSPVFGVEALAETIFL